MARAKKMVFWIIAVGGAAVLCLLGTFAFAGGISQKRLDCFEALAERQAPLLDYTYFLGQPEEGPSHGPTCYRYDMYFGALKLACLQEDGQVVSAGGEYYCGASLPALIRHIYWVTWRTAASVEERRVHRCE